MVIYAPLCNGLPRCRKSARECASNSYSLPYHARKMGIANAADSGLADLEMETKPEDVLAEIERLQQRALRSTKPPA